MPRLTVHSIRLLGACLNSKSRYLISSINRSTIAQLFHHVTILLSNSEPKLFVSISLNKFEIIHKKMSVILTSLTL